MNLVWLTLLRSVLGFSWYFPALDAGMETMSSAAIVCYVPCDHGMRAGDSQHYAWEQMKHTLSTLRKTPDFWSIARTMSRWLSQLIGRGTNQLLTYGNKTIVFLYRCVTMTAVVLVKPLHIVERLKGRTCFWLRFWLRTKTDLFGIWQRDRCELASGFPCTSGDSDSDPLSPSPSFYPLHPRYLPRHY